MIPQKFTLLKITDDSKELLLMWVNYINIYCIQKQSENLKIYLHLKW